MKTKLRSHMKIVNEETERNLNNLAEILLEEHLVDHLYSITKVLQLCDIMLFRHGAMLVGPTYGGKITVYQALSRTNVALSKTKKIFDLSEKAF
jgi:hypothetical protein